MLVAALFAVLLLLADLSAARYGGRSERWAAAVASCSAVASLFAAWPDNLRWHHVELALLVVDSVTLAGFAFIMIKSNHFWPILTTSLQLCSVASQFGPAFGRSKDVFAFALDEQVWSWLILVQILWASRPPMWRKD